MDGQGLGFRDEELSATPFPAISLGGEERESSQTGVGLMGINLLESFPQNGLTLAAVRLTG